MLEWCGYPTGEFDDTSSRRFYTPYRRVTDRRTDILQRHNPHLCIAPRDKNRKQIRLSPRFMSGVRQIKQGGLDGRRLRHDADDQQRQVFLGQCGSQVMA